MKNSSPPPLPSAEVQGTNAEITDISNDLIEFSQDLKEDLIQTMQLRSDDALRFLHLTYGLNPILRLCCALNTSPVQGLSSDDSDFVKRRNVFGSNEVSHKKGRNFLLLVCDAFKDVTLIVLMVAASISLLLSIVYCDEHVSLKNSHGHRGHSMDFNVSESFMQLGLSRHDFITKSNWIEAAAIMATVFVVAIVTAITSYEKEKQFRCLQRRIESDQHYSVIRNGQIVSISIEDIVVGDICLLQYGDILPADGLVVYSNDLKIDESSFTGEPDLVSKSISADPVLLSGTQVMEGSGRMVIIAVGLSTQAGLICKLLGKATSRSARRKLAFRQCWRLVKKTISKPFAANKSSQATYADSQSEERFSDISSLRFSQLTSRLHLKLAKLSIKIGYIGIFAAVATILILSVRFCIETFGVKNQSWSVHYLEVFIRFIILGVTVVVVSVPEGLPLALALAMAYSIRQMMRDNNLVRHIDACETVGNVTTICCDKTGTLTTNKMAVVDAYIAGKRYSQVVINDVKDGGLANTLQPHVLNVLVESICVNTAKTSLVKPSYGPALPKHVGNKTECALLALALRLLPPIRRINQENPIEQIRNRYPDEAVIKAFTFTSQRKSMSTAVRLADDDGRIRLFVKGACEVVIAKCTKMLSNDGKHVDFDKAETDRFVVQPMGCVGLRTICLAYRDLTTEEAGVLDWDNEDRVVSSLVFIGIFGIADPIRSEVPQAIKTCQKAGVTVRLVTGDGIETARSVAKICGIIQQTDFDDGDQADGPLVLDGSEFNRMIRNPKNGKIEQDRFDKIWPRLLVLARSTPEDKFVLVSGIMASSASQTGEIVAVTGNNTSDAAVLREADVGFAMGTTGSDVAKDAADVIVSDDNFVSLVKALIWGRNIYDCLGKFLQFQLTVNVVASFVTVIAAAVVEDAVVTALQLLYINLLMDTLASLALATEPPSSTVLERPPYGRNRPLITATMAKNILLNSIYQLTVMLLLIFYGDNMFSIESGRNRHQISAPGYIATQHFTMVFNTLVLMCFFNEICCRRLHNERNVFAGLHRSRLFVLIWICSFVCHVIVVQFGSIVFRTASLSAFQWLWCLLFGASQLVWCQVVATVPLERCVAFNRWFGTMPLVDAQPKVDAGSLASSMVSISVTSASAHISPDRNQSNLSASNGSLYSIKKYLKDVVNIPPLESNF